MKVAGLWRYPVKSLQGVQVDLLSLQSSGVAGDRMWGIRDLATGRILTARRRPELLAASAAYEDDVPVIVLPDGQRVEGPSTTGDALLSAWLNQPVSLVTSEGVEGGRAESFVDNTDDSSDMTEWTMPAGRFVDDGPVLVLTTASLRHGKSLHPAGAWDVRRFRPNVLIDADGDGFLEDAWVGRALSIGDVVLTPTGPCVRCTMVTREQPGGLPADVDVFRTLAKQHRGLFGILCDVARPGEVTAGSPVELGGRSTAG